MFLLAQSVELYYWDYNTYGSLMPSISTVMGMYWDIVGCVLYIEWGQRTLLATASLTLRIKFATSISGPNSSDYSGICPLVLMGTLALMIKICDAFSV